MYSLHLDMTKSLTFYDNKHTFFPFSHNEMLPLNYVKKVKQSCYSRFS